MKIIVNRCFGGFGLSRKAIQRYLELKGKECHFYEHDYKANTYKKVGIDSKAYMVTILTKDYGDLFKEPEWKKGQKNDKQSKEYQEFNDIYFSEYNVKRDDPVAIKVVEELGSKANGTYSKLEVVEIPDGVKYQIDEYDGIESIHEVHRSW